jgi:hypothetical protein
MLCIKVQLIKYIFIINIAFSIINMRGATEVKESQNWATSKKMLRTTGLDVGASTSYNPMDLCGLLQG